MRSIHSWFCVSAFLSLDVSTDDVIGDPRQIAARIPKTAENEVFGEYLGKYLAYKDAILQSRGKCAYT